MSTRKIAVMAFVLGGLLAPGDRPTPTGPTVPPPVRGVARAVAGPRAELGPVRLPWAVPGPGESAEPPAGLSRGEWGQIRGLVDKGRYHATSVARAGEPTILKASNPAQGYVTTFQREGIELASRPVEGRDWRLGVRALAYGRAGDVQPLPAGEPVAVQELVEYRRGPVKEWYRNRPEGLEQGFMIAKPPAGAGGGLLVIELAVDGELRVAVEGDGAVFADMSGRAVVRYTGLRAWDAGAQELPARMEPAAGGLRLLVEAEAARFPVTVDPTFVQEAKLLGNTEPAGATNDYFGYSVAVSGDTAIVGASGERWAYVFQRSGTTWTPQQRLMAWDGGGGFADAVAISGDTAVVGAPGGRGSAYVFVRNAGVWTPQQKLTASDGADGDSFGASVAVSGDTAVVGADRDAVGGNAYQGSAYVFVRSGGGWSEQQKLTAADGATHDYFGSAVAVYGDTAVVGAPYGAVGADVSQGSAYVFARSGTTWGLQQKLIASDGAAAALFGTSVAVSEDTAVVGAPRDDVGLSVDQGSAYVFVRVAGIWSQQQKLTASDGAAHDQFGVSLAVSGDTVVVGAPLDAVWALGDRGSAYVLVRSGTTWIEQQQLTATDSARGDGFGFSVAVSGDTAVVGVPFDDLAFLDQGSAYVFKDSGTTWRQQQMLWATAGAASDQFGASLAVSGDTVVVGAPYGNVGANTDQGSAYVFIRSGGVWGLQQKLTALDGAAGDRFGASVAVSGDTAVVGAPDDAIGPNAQQGSAYVFARSGTTWSEQQKLTASDGAPVDVFGGRVAVSGDTVVVGAYADDVGANANQGSAYVFVRSAGVWSEQQKLTAWDGGADDIFGYALAVSGETAVVGALGDVVGANFQQGSAYVFVRDAGVWSLQQKLTASDGAAMDSFGVSVAVSADTALVGAIGHDVGANANQGAAYVFVRSAGVWSEQQELTAASGTASDYFGLSVAVSGDVAAVGVPYDDEGANVDQGSVHVFIRSGTAWSEHQKLMASDGAAGDRFGHVVAVSGDTAVVGAAWADVGANVDQGSAYVFREPGDLIFKDGFQ